MDPHGRLEPDSTSHELDYEALEFLPRSPFRSRDAAPDNPQPAGQPCASRRTSRPVWRPT
ncbi:UNVERIFIED_CONTAM: hypothetical protein Sradi_6941600 [Sesamum radiatum]|uniref:Uncharacterized protein n=1 Tax=Sesamum radiatum TaxID=300843 RepID=A0AAW2JGF7_SESRA